MMNRLMKTNRRGFLGAFALVLVMGAAFAASAAPIRVAFRGAGRSDLMLPDERIRVDLSMFLEDMLTREPMFRCVSEARTTGIYKLINSGACEYGTDDIWQIYNRYYPVDVVCNYFPTGRSGARMAAGWKCKGYTLSVGTKKGCLTKEWYTKAAELGDDDAQFNLANMYLEGRGVKQDTAQAVKWLSRAASLNNASAMCSLGILCAEGQGVEKNDAKAVYWFLLAAQLGNINACYNLGVMYENARGVEWDGAKAAALYRKAAELGHAEARLNLGVMYVNGSGVEKDAAKAAYWFGKAAEQGNADAQYNLGSMYDHGEGVEKDAAKAVDLYRKAAQQGCTEAAQRLKELGE